MSSGNLQEVSNTLLYQQIGFWSWEGMGNLGVQRNGDLRNQKVLSEATMSCYLVAVLGSFAGVKPGEF